MRKSEPESVGGFADETRKVTSLPTVNIGLGETDIFGLASQTQILRRQLLYHGNSQPSRALIKASLVSVLHSGTKIYDCPFVEQQHQRLFFLPG